MAKKSSKLNMEYSSSDESMKVNERLSIQKTNDENKKFVSYTKKKKKKAKDVDFGGEGYDVSINVEEKIEGIINKKESHSSRIRNRVVADDEEGNNKGNVFCIVVHRTTQMLSKTKGLLKKPTSKNMSSQTNQYIEQLCTSPADTHDICHQRQFEWNEALIIPYDYSWITQRETDIFVVCEIVGTTPNDEQTTNNYSIAWAYLKLNQENEQLYRFSRVPLQLYYPKGSRNHLAKWITDPIQKKYPATLTITIKSIERFSEKISDQINQMKCKQEKEAPAEMSEDDETEKTESVPVEEVVEEEKKIEFRKRRLGAVRYVPNREFIIFPSSLHGCTSLRFSNNGLWIALGVGIESSFIIQLYDVISGKCLKEYSGHHSTIYDIQWSCTDEYMMSASADGLVRVWQIHEGEPKDKPNILFNTFPIAVCSHPKFIYSVIFIEDLVKNQIIIASAGFDRTVRLWRIRKGDSCADLLQELLPSTVGHINTICYVKKLRAIFSGDSTGGVRMWVAGGKDWTHKGDIMEKELNGIEINHILYCEKKHKLVIGVRDNIIRLYDLATNRIFQKFYGGRNEEFLTRGTISPCGTFLFFSTDDNYVNCWNIDTGQQICTYQELHYPNPVTAIHFHPFYDLIAFGCIGSNQPAVMYEYNIEITARNMGLTTENENETSTYENVAANHELEGVRKGAVVHTKVTNADSPWLPFPHLSPSLLGYKENVENINSDLKLQFYEPTKKFANQQVKRIEKVKQMLDAVDINYFDKRKTTSTHQRHAIFTPMGRQGAMININLKKQDVFATQMEPIVDNNLVTAIKDYVGENVNELTFDKGQKILVIHKNNVNWWYGELVEKNGNKMRTHQLLKRTGYFPSKFVKC
ncbi:hypothetical protein SNEBB_010236 [Seison nebaliae]|nr:hypothetical protein SNEBB_010236 [Seison nebaliae]